jgi:hypothetical protein
LTLKSGHCPQLPLEMGIVEFSLGPELPHAVELGTPAGGQPQRKPPAAEHSHLKVLTPGHTAPEQTPPARPAETHQRPEKDQVPQPPAEHREPPREPVAARPEPADGSLSHLWARIVEDIRPHNRSVEALLKGCELKSIEDDCLNLEFQWEFHKTKLEENKNRVIVEKVASKALGKKCRISCSLASKGNGEGEALTPQKKREAVQGDARVKAAMNIFNAEIIDE